MPESVKFHQALEDMLVLHEDLRLKPYRCPAGKLSIGIGRNMEDNGITEGEARFMARNDIARVLAEVRRVIPGFNALSHKIADLVRHLPHRRLAATPAWFLAGHRGLGRWRPCTALD